MEGLVKGYCHLFTGKPLRMKEENGEINWPDVINGGVAMPTIFCVGVITAGYFLVAALVIGLLSILLLNAGIIREFRRFPVLTRFMILVTPAYLLIAWLTYYMEASFQVRVVMIVSIGGLHIISNLLMKDCYKR